NSQPEAAYAEKQITDIALGLFMKPQCMRMADLGAKIDEIRQTISKNKIKGLIFISQKFCDNTLLFYPLLRENLNMLRIPSLFLEIEHNNLSLGQIKTRIQAFLEII
ncbi:MAG: 2-hydroxyacyl-CoA dehydratase, partial [Actinobacteria bacterium]|nr:2-hydroxyacyl-CoA dehydratase [Actinomycetota bacterium]